MANCCSTQIRFYGNETAISDFFNRILHAVSEDTHPDKSICDRSWLGNITKEFGIDFEREGISVRGNITDISYDSSTIYTDTVWTPKLQMWNAIIAKHYSNDSGEPLIYFDWFAEEFGCGIYCTNNISRFSGMNYCVDYEIGSNTDMKYRSDEDDILEIINFHLAEVGINPIASIRELDDIHTELDKHDWFISVYKLKEVDTYYFD